MEVSQRALAFLLCRAFLCGVALGAFYDVLRITRLWMGEGLPPAARALEGRLALPENLRFFHMPRVFRRPGGVAGGILIFFEDVLFCLVCAVVLILELYVCNDGQFRLSALACMLIGVFAYLISLGRGVLLVSGTLTAILRAAVQWTVALVCFPFCHMFRWVGRLTAPMRRRVAAGVRNLFFRVGGAWRAFWEKVKGLRRKKTGDGEKKQAQPVVEMRSTEIEPRRRNLSTPGSFHAGSGCTVHATQRPENGR